MGWVRSKWLLRCTALLLLGAMLPMALAPTSRAASGSLSSSYAEWVRAQLRMPADAAVEEALHEAAETDARTFRTFAEAFLKAYEARHPLESAAHVFVDRDLSNDALIAYLQRRYTEISGEAVLLRLRLVAAHAGPSFSSGASGTLASHPRNTVSSAPSLFSAQEIDDVASARRPLTPARPQGP